MTAELCGPAAATWTESLSTASDRSLLSNAERKPLVTSPVGFSIAAEKLRKWSLLILLLLLFPPRIHGSIIAAQCCAIYGPIRESEISKNCLFLQYGLCHRSYIRFHSLTIWISPFSKVIIYLFGLILSLMTIFWCNTSRLPLLVSYINLNELDRRGA